MYAIIETCGKQYKITKGDVIFFEKLNVEKGKKVTFDNVILLFDKKTVKVGTPYINEVKVEGKVICHGKGKKILVYKYKPKKNYRRTYGHRQPYTKVEITKIEIPTEKKENVETELVSTEIKKVEKKATTKVGEKTISKATKSEDKKVSTKPVKKKTDVKEQKITKKEIKS